VSRFGEKAGSWLWNRFTVHYTPKHGSWLNQAEIALSLFSRQCPGQTPDRRPGFSAQGNSGWNRGMNHGRVTIQWRFTRRNHCGKSALRDAIRISRDEKSETGEPEWKIRITVADPSNGSDRNSCSPLRSDNVPIYKL